MLTDQSKVCGKRHIEYSYCCWHHRWLFCFQQIFEIGNQRFPNAKKLSHALARRTELIISFNLKTAPLFFPVKRIILRTQMCRMSVTSFTSGIYTRGSVSRSTIFLKKLDRDLKDERMYRYKRSVCRTISSKMSEFKQGSVDHERSSDLF